MKKTLFYFFKKHIQSSKRQIVSLTLAALLICIKTVSKLQQQQTANNINNPKDEESKKNFYNLFYFIWISTVYIFSVPSLDLVASSFENLIIKSVFTSSYAEFIQYRFNNWVKLLQGDLYSVIVRRSMAVAKFFKHFFFDAIDTFSYISFGVITLIIRYGFVTHFKYGIGFLLFVPLLSNALTTIRNLIQRKSNDAYDKGENTLKDIFLNYEMIHTYNTFDQEIINYRKAMRNAKFWFFMYWLSNDIIEMINKIAKMLLVAVVFGKIDPTKYTKAIIFDHMTVFQSVSKRLNSFIENAKKVVEASENSLNSKLDLLKIENTDHLMIKSSFDSQIEIVNLSKYYNENLVFKNLNFTIKRGDKIAITGVNGSGKSSFIKSLVGIENYEGDILIDGANTKTIRESSYSRLIAYVPQDPVVFSATLYDNITSFNSKHYPESVLSTVQEYDMNEIFKEIGYKTVLAEGGSNLSSAQRQKISFMRAVIRDSPIVLFDEVTSEMDKGYESFLVDSILTKMADKTVIMIVHNLDLLAKFDKVIFFNNNTACECLPLNELVSQNGNIEFKSYLDGFNSINK